MWGQAQCLPVEMVEPFLRWERDTWLDVEYGWDDFRLRLWLAMQGMWSWATVPSLVEHGAPSQSLIGNGGSQRVARRFAGENVACDQVDWRFDEAGLCLDRSFPPYASYMRASKIPVTLAKMRKIHGR